MEIWDVMEGYQLTAINLWKTVEFVSNKIILTKELFRLVKIARILSKSQDTARLMDAMNWLMPLHTNLFLWQLMPQTGLCIRVECLATAQIDLITLVYWLAYWMEFGKSRIHGEHLGVKVDISDWLQETLVEYAHQQPPIQTNDQLTNNQFIKYLTFFSKQNII